MFIHIVMCRSYIIFMKKNKLISRDLTIASHHLEQRSAPGPAGSPLLGLPQDDASSGQWLNDLGSSSARTLGRWGPRVLRFR
jgi:hypothetical protein